MNKLYIGNSLPLPSDDGAMALVWLYSRQLCIVSAKQNSSHITRRGDENKSGIT
jgi:hypothetical protein